MTGIDQPILIDFPDELETERLLLCAPQAGDGRVVNEAIVESHAELKQWLTWADTLPTVERSEELNRIAVAEFVRRDVLRMYVRQKSDRRFVGLTSLHHIDWSVPSFEIGYWVRTSLVGRGYASESVRGVADLAFGLFRAERMVIRCDPRNDLSAAVARRVGFAFEGHICRDRRENDDTLSDAYVFSMIRSEWEALGHPQVTA